MYHEVDPDKHGRVEEGDKEGAAFVARLDVRHIHIAINDGIGGKGTKKSAHKLHKDVAQHGLA